jgi:hypothetical protein
MGWKAAQIETPAVTRKGAQLLFAALLTCWRPREGQLAVSALPNHHSADLDRWRIQRLGCWLRKDDYRPLR